MKLKLIVYGLSDKNAAVGILLIISDKVKRCEC